MTGSDGQFSFVYTCFLYSFWSAMSVLQWSSLYACTMGNTASFTVNVALVASQWQHHTWTISTHPSIIAEHKAGQVAIFKSSVWPNQWSKPAYQIWWRVLN